MEIISNQICHPICHPTRWYGPVLVKTGGVGTTKKPQKIAVFNTERDGKGRGELVFKTSAFNHSATHPRPTLMPENEQEVKNKKHLFYDFLRS